MRLVHVFMISVCYIISDDVRSEEHTSELQSRPHISYAVFCLKKKKKKEKKKKKKNKHKQERKRTRDDESEINSNDNNDYT